MPMNKPDIEQMQGAVATSLHEHWVFFLVEGIILVILGLAAIVIPRIATLTVEILFGWLFLISGIVGLITTFWMRHAPGFWWSLVSAILGIAVGIVLLSRPLSGVLSLALVQTFGINATKRSGTLRGSCGENSIPDFWRPVVFDAKLSEFELTFPDPMYEFNAGDGDRGALKALQSEHWTQTKFDRPVILLDQIVIWHV
jgi:hypothetical protein